MDSFHFQQSRAYLHRARHIFTDYRKSLSPINLEAQMFLNVIKKHWNVSTVQEITSWNEKQ